MRDRAALVDILAIWSALWWCWPVWGSHILTKRSAYFSIRSKSTLPHDSEFDSLTPITLWSGDTLITFYGGYQVTTKCIERNGSSGRTGSWDELWLHCNFPYNVTDLSLLLLGFSCAGAPSGLIDLMQILSVFLCFFLHCEHAAINCLPSWPAMMNSELTAFAILTKKKIIIRREKKAAASPLPPYPPPPPPQHPHSKLCDKGSVTLSPTTGRSLRALQLRVQQSFQETISSSSSLIYIQNLR